VYLNVNNSIFCSINLDKDKLVQINETNNRFLQIPIKYNVIGMLNNQAYNMIQLLLNLCILINKLIFKHSNVLDMEIQLIEIMMELSIIFCLETLIYLYSFFSSFIDFNNFNKMPNAYTNEKLPKFDIRHLYLCLFILKDVDDVEYVLKLDQPSIDLKQLFPINNHSSKRFISLLNAIKNDDNNLNAYISSSNDMVNLINVNDVPLTQIQMNILLGTLLGDASIEQKTLAYSHEQSQSHQEYTNWLGVIFINLNITKTIRYRSGRLMYGLEFTHKLLDQFNKYVYKTIVWKGETIRIKQIPPDHIMKKYFNELSFIVHHQDNGTNYANTYSICLDNLEIPDANLYINYCKELDSIISVQENMVTI
jgi:hypothetical protein